MICKGPKYRFPVPIDFKSCGEEIAGALQEFCNRWCKREHVESNALTLSLPNATVVEFTIHCQTRLQSKFKGTVDSCLFNRYKELNCLFFISKCSGDIIVLYIEVNAIFCTRMEFSFFVMSLDFAEIKNIENMSMGMAYRTH